MNKFLPIICLGLSACAVGPDFEKPTKELPSAFENAEALPKKSGDIKQWWKNFQDPQLDSLIERALKNNLDLEMARTSLASARAVMGVTQSGLFPTLDASGGMTESGEGTAATRPRYNARLAAEWEIDVFGQTRRGIESAVADYMAANADKCAVELSVASEVALAYYTYRANQEELKITSENLETQKRTYEITKRLSDSGKDPYLDTIRAKAIVENTSAQYLSAKTALSQSRYALELLLGLPVGGLAEELKEYKAMPMLEAYIPESVPARLVERRPDVVSAEYKIKSASAKIGQAEADFYPKFYVSGDISYRAPNLGNLFETQYGTWSVGPTVRWNLFSAGKTYYNVKKQEAIAKEAGLSWNKIVLTALKEVEDSLVASVNEAERIKYLLELVENHKRAYKASMDFYTHGLGSNFMDVLDSQRTMLASQQSLVESRRMILANMINLYKALGGGWSPEDMYDPEYENDKFLLF